MAADAGFPEAHIWINRDPFKKRVMNWWHFVGAPGVIVQPDRPDRSGATRFLAVVCSASLNLFIECFEDSSILGFPFNKSIRAAALNHCCGRARAGKLYISCKPVETVLPDEGAIVDQLVPKCDDIWPFRRRLALL